MSFERECSKKYVHGLLPISLERTLFSASVLQSGKGEIGLRQRGEWRIKN